MFNARSLIKKTLKKIKNIGTKLYQYKCNKKVVFLLKKTGHMVYSGPFATLPIPSNILLGNERFYIIGSYEKCLHQEINRLITLKPDFGIVIGAHKGYYVLGMLYTIQSCKITAFESREHLRLLMESWSNYIGASNRLSIKGFADIQALIEIKDQPNFLIIDCEGYESELLDPHQISWLSNTTIICELHDFYRPGLTSLLISRFCYTHSIKLIESQPLNVSEYPVLNFFSKKEAEDCLREERWIQDPHSHEKIATSGRYFIAIPKLD